ncbi:serine protease filzig isoform X2 [Euwallacea similis]|uniref:serine protease filzig isoform X2 n=1 Tax=Euwallacea similis TaxID=1736056 RepID=UPI00344D3846
MKNESWHYFILCFLYYNVFQVTLADVSERSGLTRTRGARKLFGGYRITPKFCKATRTPTNPPGGPNICMFNHECSQRNGQVVGACMDGFLFGACCQLPKDEEIGEILTQEIPALTALDNKLSSKFSPTTHRTTPMYDITSHGVSQIAASLLGQNPPFSGGSNSNIISTGTDNKVNIDSVLGPWPASGVTHSKPETFVGTEDNEINSSYFSSATVPLYEKKTTPYGHEETTLRYGETNLPPILQISVSNAPVGYTPLPSIQRPIFRPKPPKPTDENYILVPTLVHAYNKTEHNEEVTLDNLNLLSLSTTTGPLSTFSFVSSSAPTTKRPPTTKKPPSTSYIFSTTVPPRRKTTARRPIQTKKPTKSVYKPSKYSISTQKPNSSSNFTPRPKPPSTSYVYSPTFDPTRKPPNGTYAHSSTARPPTVAHSTFANSPEAFPGSHTTPHVYGSDSTSSTYRPSSVSSTIAGPSFTVTSQPLSQYSPYPSPAPTLIVLGPVNVEKDDGFVVASSSSTEVPSKYQSITTSRPSQFSSLPQRKPVNHVTINNHVTQNIYSTQRPQTSSSQSFPSPTVIITPKPTISSSLPPSANEDTEAIVVTSASDLINFPPDRNPNLNISQPVYSEEDITTPNFVEDDAMNDKVESFVNQIIYGLQEPFNDLKDIVYNKHINATGSPTASSIVTTKKPVKKQGSTTRKPVTKPTSVKTTTKRLATTRRPPLSLTTTKRPTTTRKPPTTVQNFIEIETESELHQNYRDQCGVRPLLKTGRIVGGRGAVFGEFPWQVLVRESTWLGLFTKNKCGGVLISDKYVITAAHCQPGFLASLVAVFGEYDISGDLESRKPISRNVKRVIVHRKYDAATFENDLALLELENPVKFDAHIIPVCLPPDNSDYTKRMATVTGWGRLKYGGGVPSVLQEVQVPIMENHVCQDMFRTAGHSKVILESFLCAGYANGQKDACEGDSGGPLVVQRPDGRYELAGTVSHGIKCAAPYLPGVYMRTTYYKPWITSITGIE